MYEMHKTVFRTEQLYALSPGVEVHSQTAVVIGPHCVTAVAKVRHRVHPVLVLVVTETTAEVDIDNSVIVHLDLEFSKTLSGDGCNFFL